MHAAPPPPPCRAAAPRTRVVWLGVADQHVVDLAPPLGQLLVQRAHVQAAELLCRGAGGGQTPSRWGSKRWNSQCEGEVAQRGRLRPNVPQHPNRRTMGGVHQCRLVGAKDEVRVVGGALCVLQAGVAAGLRMRASTWVHALQPAAAAAAAALSAPPPARTQCQTGRGPAAWQGHTAAGSWLASALGSGSPSCNVKP